MENKKTISNLVIRKSKDRLVKALDDLELMVERRINFLKALHEEEINKLKDEIFALKKQNSLVEQVKPDSTSTHELDDTIDNLEKFLKERHADNNC